MFQSTFCVQILFTAQSSFCKSAAYLILYNYPPRGGEGGGGVNIGETEMQSVEVYI